MIELKEGFPIHAFVTVLVKISRAVPVPALQFAIVPCRTVTVFKRTAGFVGKFPAVKLAMIGADNYILLLVFADVLIVTV